MRSSILTCEMMWQADGPSPLRRGPKRNKDVEQDLGTVTHKRERERASASKETKLSTEEWGLGFDQNIIVVQGVVASDGGRYGSAQEPVRGGLGSRKGESGEDFPLQPSHFALGYHLRHCGAVCHLQRHRRGFCESCFLPPSLPKPPFPHFCCLPHWSQLLHHRRSLCLAASSVIASWCVWVEQMLEASESMHQVLAHHVSKCKSSLIAMEEAGTENSWKIWCLESLSHYSFHQGKRSRWS